jgi:hypothetical protein
MPFEKFSETRRSFKPKISIRSNGSIAFNTGAVEKFRLGRYKFVTLFFDRENNKIGVKPTEASEDGSHALHHGKTGASLSGTRFLAYFDMIPPKTIRADAKWDEQEGMIVATISRQG